MNGFASGAIQLQAGVVEDEVQTLCRRRDECRKRAGAFLLWKKDSLMTGCDP